MTVLLQRRHHFARPEDAAGWYVPVPFDVAHANLAGVARGAGRTASGHTAVSSRPDGPLLLPAGDRALAADADGLTLQGADGTAIKVGGDLVELPAGDGVYWLESAEAVGALSVPGRWAGAAGRTGEDGLLREDRS